MKKSGFTIVETLVAVAILMIAIAGPLTIVNKSLRAAMEAQDQVTAAYLAQDVIEYIENVRDNNMISGRTWLDKISDCTESSYCSLNTLTGNPNASGPALGAGIAACSSSCRLYLSAAGYSPDNTGTATKYSRYFYIVPNKNNPSHEVKIIVMVKWTNGSVESVVTYEAEIFEIIK
jgi:Tfp pilus assembly protein PilV